MARADTAFVASAVNELLTALDGETRFTLAADPLNGIPSLLGVQLHVRAEARDRSCPVDGSYYPDPPTINVAASASHGRRNFTALHELGHHLITERYNLRDILATQPDGGRAAEEVICDRFAADILLPPDLVAATIRPEGPHAEDVERLHARQPAASRSACCAGVARHMASPGYVVLADVDGTVRYAAASAPGFVVAPGTPQPDSLLERAGRTGHARGQDSLRYGTGSRSQPYHVDAHRSADGRYVFAIYTRSAPPWGGLNILADDEPRGVETTCTRCDTDFEAFGRPCATCGDHRCPACDRCSCPEGPQQAVCPDCHMLGNAQLIASGACPNC